MRKIVFVVGGARSGKSTYAVDLARESGQKVVFLATCTFCDEEMDARIKRHQESRPASWDVVNEGTNIAAVLAKSQHPDTTVLIDCLGMWVFNLMEEYAQDTPVEAEFQKFIQTFKDVQGQVIIVSNEVGSGLVPEHASGRRFRDLLGRLNQMVAKAADTVVLMQVGIPTILKQAKG
ncbi:MAG: bifunctional adenosylcobinamide kinase/adenosylcobinamide-phosphate guanylyltransferase [Candidatus Omnitrophica bacterium]|nr:bifunctional adenosylcobinamide kinase/adenosylcobinamide-phosphate guanylyltransferase [Candidatus Omnitrophota bacterium]